VGGGKLIDMMVAGDFESVGDEGKGKSSLHPSNQYQRTWKEELRDLTHLVI
jgi:hypothetical protein